MTRTERWTFTTTKDSGETYTATAFVDVEEDDETVIMDRIYAASLGLYEGDTYPLEFGPNVGDVRVYTRPAVRVPYEKIKALFEREGGVFEATA